MKRDAIPAHLRRQAKELDITAEAIEGLYREIRHKNHLIQRLCIEIDRQRADEALVQQMERFERDLDAERMPK